jgi:response regulator RpfG family c-di-GMP phosphodiesterase
MDEHKHTILCVDDEENILHSLKRLLRREGYRFLTASSGAEGLNLLKENDVHLVITDQRMPEMSGTDFLAKVKDKHPDVLRVVLTGYTDVDSITESINKGHIFKFFLKPWNDQNLKLEIKQALEQYDLIQANRGLNAKVVEQNEELKRINENLESLVQERTKDLEIQNQALELSHAILEDMPLPIIGVSAEQMIVLINHEVNSLLGTNKGIEIGKMLSDYFTSDVEEKMAEALTSNRSQALKEYRLSDRAYDIDLAPLSGRFQGKGVIMVLRQQVIG